MWNKLANFVALIRGRMFIIFGHLTNRNIVGGQGVHLYPGSILEIAENCTMKVGKMLILNRNAQILVRGGILELGSNVSLGYRTIINCHQNISIGDNVNIAPDVKIYDHDHNFKDYHLSGNEWRTCFFTEKIEIGSNVWIGANTIILRGTTIGDNTVIGAGCILKGKFDGNCVITQKRNTSIKIIKERS